MRARAQLPVFPAALVWGLPVSLGVGLAVGAAVVGFVSGFILVSRLLSTEEDPSSQQAETPGEPDPPPADEPEHLDLEPGDRYRIVRTLGHGGHGVVHLADDTVLDREVVLKQLRTPGLGDSARRKVLREARMAGRVAHPNLVTVYDVARMGEDDVIVMEHVPAGSLEDRLAKGSIPLDQCVEIAAGVLTGLEELHAEGIVHRDVKPANVLLGSDGTPKLSDLGIAQRVDQAASTDGSHPGTLRYMAPEQLRGDEIGPWTDVYAVGALLYRCATGRHHLVDRPDDEALLRQAIVHGTPRLPVETLPDALNRALARALAPDPSGRYASARAFREAIVDPGTLAR